MSSWPTVRNPGSAAAEKDSTWGLQSSHHVVEKRVNIRTYHHRVLNAHLNGEIDQTRGASGTYGEAYHYAEAYTGMGDRYAHDEDLQSGAATSMLACVTSVTSTARPDSAASAVAPPWRPARS